MILGFIPNWNVAMLTYVCFSSVLTVPVLFPFVGFIVVDFGMAKDPDGSGYYAGLLSGAMMLGRTLSSYPCGYIADRYGRVRVIQICTLFCGLLTIFFGFAPNYWIAVIARLLTGIFNPVMAISKSLVSQLVPPHELVAAMTMLTAQWCFGLTVGPMLGGFLYGTCCGQFTYLLPCLFCGGLQLLGLLPLYHLQKVIDKRNDEIALKRSSSEVELTSKSYLVENIINSSKVVPIDVQPLAVGKVSDEPRFSTETPSTNEEDDQEVCNVYTGHWLWGNYAFMWILVLYMIESFVALSVEDLFSLWAVASRQAGGLQVESDFIGLVLGVQGVFNLLFQLFIGPRWIRKWGLKKSIYIGFIMAGIACALTPVSFHLMPEDEDQPKILLGALSVILIMVRGIGFYFGFTAIFVLANNAVPETHLSRMNGVSMTLSSLMKFSGPALMAPLFAWSIEQHRPFPIDRYFTFILCGVLMFAAACFVRKIPNWLQHKQVPSLPIKG